MGINYKYIHEIELQPRLRYCDGCFRSCMNMIKLDNTFFFFWRIIHFLWKLSEFKHKCWIRCSAVWKWFSQSSHVWFLGLEIPFLVCMCLVAQLCLILCDPIGCSPPGSSVHGDSPGKNTGEGNHSLLQGFSLPRDWTQVSHIAGGFFMVWGPRETLGSS